MSDEGKFYLRTGHYAPIAMTPEEVAAVAAWRCDWVPDELNEGPDCPYCADEMCARFDGLRCTHDIVQRHGYKNGGEG